MEIENLHFTKQSELCWCLLLESFKNDATIVDSDYDLGFVE